MSTRGIIAHTTGTEGQFIGRYHHSDSMPTGLGAELWKLLHGHFSNDLGKLVHYLIDAPHAICGWSDIVEKDFSLKPGYTWQRVLDKGLRFPEYTQLPDYRRPQCFAGRPGETEDTRTQDDLKDTDCEWLYVFDVEQRKLFVRDLRHDEDVAVVDPDSPEPNWEHVECGGSDENWRRCRHLAWVHGLLPKTSNLSTKTYLEQRPLSVHDAVAVIVNGRTLKLTGSGGDAHFMNMSRVRMSRISGEPQKNWKPFPPDTWIATAKYSNGRTVELPIAYRTENGFTPYRGVKWVYPPTINNPSQIVGMGKD